MILSLTTEYGWGPHDLEKMLKIPEDSIYACDGRKIMEGLDQQFKLNHYEITCWIPKTGIEGIRDFIRENPEKKISSVHAYAPLAEDFVYGPHPADCFNLASCDETTRQHAIIELKKSISLAASFNCNRVLVHGGFNEPNKERRENMNALMRSIEETLKYIYQNNLGITLGIENSLMHNQIFIRSDEIRQIVSFYPQAGLWLDSGHAFANPTSDFYKIVETCNDLVVGLHVHNNNGKDDLHAPLDRGEIDFEYFFTPFKDRIIREELPVILELYSYRSNPSAEDVKRSIDLIKRING